MLYMFRAIAVLGLLLLWNERPELRCLQTIWIIVGTFANHGVKKWDCLRPCFVSAVRNEMSLNKGLNYSISRSLLYLWISRSAVGWTHTCWCSQWRGLFILFMRPVDHTVFGFKLLIFLLLVLVVMCRWNWYLFVLLKTNTKLNSVSHF